MKEIKGVYLISEAGIKHRLVEKGGELYGVYRYWGAEKFVPLVLLRQKTKLVEKGKDLYECKGIDNGYIFQFKEAELIFNGQSFGEKRKENKALCYK